MSEPLDVLKSVLRIRNIVRIKYRLSHSFQGMPRKCRKDADQPVHPHSCLRGYTVRANATDAIYFIIKDITDPILRLRMRRLIWTVTVRV